MRILFTLSLVLAAARPAGADDLAHARRLFEQGRVAFETGGYADAIRLFEQSYAEAARPALLYNIAAAHRKQYEVDRDASHLRRARVAYDNYLRQAERPDDAADAQRQIAELDAQLKAAEPPSDATVRIDFGAAPATAAVPAPVEPASSTAATATAEPARRRAWLWGALALAVVVIAGAAVGVGVAASPHGVMAPLVNAGNYVPMFR